MKNDIDIARSIPLLPIEDIAAKAGIHEDEYFCWGRSKAKVSLDLLNRVRRQKQGKLILVTTINPTSSGEGKTTVTIGLAQALAQLGKKTMLGIREPSMGPIMGKKGGATGGGYAQVLPMEDMEHPQGIFLSNGPGDPAAVPYAVETIRGLLGQKPIFGICLGHQLLGLAFGGKTYKLKFGHRGANQPVKNLINGRVEITSQNHGFCVDLDTLPAGEVEVTHINLNDRSLEGIRHRRLPVFSVQYHPEASAGPHDSAYLFDEFVNLMDPHSKE